ncbi:hypothetical protein PG991_016253 [Apiospora marii]|uniref:Peptidase S54 rhomboid domain-containing protein n=1 Tax=Apiospora marii TaxID=335849 RepID=A0ABR1QZI8_9PEZI
MSAVQPARLGQLTPVSRWSCRSYLTPATTATAIRLRMNYSSSEKAAGKTALPNFAKVAIPPPLSRAAPASSAPKPIVASSTGTVRRCQRIFIWGFVGVSCVVSWSWMASTGALTKRIKSLRDIKTRMGCDDMSDEEFKAFLEKGQFDAQQLLVLQEHGEHIQGTEGAISSQALHKAVRGLRDHWQFSLRNWCEGRYYTVFTSAFTHSNTWHLSTSMAALPYLLNMAFRSSLGPWSVVSLAAGSLAGANLGTAINILYALRSSPAKGRKGEANVDAALLHAGGMGSSGIIAGVGAALLVLTPRARILGILPLWAVVPWHVVVDIYGQFGKDLRQVIRKGIAGVPLDKGDDVMYAAHLGGTAFGVLFALWKLRMGWRF